MAISYPKVFEPGRIGGVALKNRIVMAPMGTGGLTNSDGSLTQRCIDYYAERARGGVGLIISGCTRAENEIERIPIHIPPGPAAKASYGELAEAVHHYGAKIFVQLTAGFGRVLGSGLIDLVGRPVSSSALPTFWNPRISTRALRTEEVEHIVAAFGKAARVLAEAGIDGIHLHGHEGYLFDQFASACWNKRQDKYGGSLEGRLRFPMETLRSIKKAVGEHYPVIYQLGLKHYIRGNWPGPWSGILPGQVDEEAGRDTEEGLAALELLEKAGFDAFHVDAGCYDSWYWAHPPGYQKHGCMLDMAVKAKEAVSVPIIAVGRLDDPEIAHRALEENRADLISLGRAFLCDPHWPRKVKQGDIAGIRPCIGCQYCLQRMMQFGKPLGCAVNPVVGREKHCAISRAFHPKKIMIIGGGIAGMEAARVVKTRGHEVSLYEKGPALGGHLLAAQVPDFKKDIGRLCDWYRTQLDRLGVLVILNTGVAAERVEAEAPDAVILATGSRPVIPKIPGLDREAFISCIDVLLGRKATGKKVLVVGGGLVGCETALWLSRQGKSVTIAEILPQVDTGAFAANEMMLLDMLTVQGVEILTGTTLKEVGDPGTVILTGAGEGEPFKCDSVIFATGLEADRDLYDLLKDLVAEIYIVGDGQRPRKIQEAIWDAFFVGLTIGDVPF